MFSMLYSLGILAELMLNLFRRQRLLIRPSCAGPCPPHHPLLTGPLAFRPQNGQAWAHLGTLHLATSILEGLCLGSRVVPLLRDLFQPPSPSGLFPPLPYPTSLSSSERTSSLSPLQVERMGTECWGDSSDADAASLAFQRPACETKAERQLSHTHTHTHTHTYTHTRLELRQG